MTTDPDMIQEHPTAGEHVACVGCGGTVPDVAGPTHPYMHASAGCWQLYSLLCAFAYTPAAGPALRAHHVDCYAVQHPGRADRDRRQRQSVAVHLVSLCLLVEFDQPPDRAPATRSRASRHVLPALGRHDWPLLAAPDKPHRLTAADMHAALETGRANEAFPEWVETCWAAWAAHHPTIRSWAQIMIDTA